MEDRDKADMFMKFYEEQCTHGRHLESQRQLVVGFFITLAAGLLSIMGTLKFSLSCAPLAVFVFALGIYAARFVPTYATKFDEASKRRRRYREMALSLSGKYSALDGSSKPGIPSQAESPRLRVYWDAVGWWISALGLCALLVILEVNAKKVQVAPSSNGCCACRNVHD